MSGNRKMGFAAIILAAGLLEARSVALAAESGAAPSGPGSAQVSQDSNEAEIKELRERLDERDAVIRNLLQRVERLERERSTTASGDPASAAPTTNETTAPPDAAPPNGPAVPVPVAQVNNAGPPPAPPAAPAPNPPQPPMESESPPAAGPGSFTVSDEDAQRALERALVQTGAALLPFGQFEFVPSLNYQFQRLTQPAQIVLTTDGAVLITEDITRTTQLEAGALLRMGLPFEAQAEIGLPWEYKDVTFATRVVGAGLSERIVSVQGLGDLSVSLTKQVLVESDVRPGIFVGAGWNSNLGQTKDHVALGTGFDEFTAAITAVKRQDPLVFTAGFAYQVSLVHNNFKPGDQFIPSVGLLLAVSPETSLRFAQQISIGTKDQFNGTPIPGSEKASGIFTFGVLSVLGRGLVVNLTGGIGETPDAPDLILQLGFPIRLN